MCNSADGHTAIVAHAEDAVTKLHLYDAQTFMRSAELPLPDVGAGFGIPLVPRPRLSPDASSALLTFSSASSPLSSNGPTAGARTRHS